MVRLETGSGGFGDGVKKGVAELGELYCTFRGCWVLVDSVDVHVILASFTCVLPVGSVSFFTSQEKYAKFYYFLLFCIFQTFQILDVICECIWQTC